MDREEDIGGPVVGERRDIRVGGCLAAQVVALHRLRRVAVAFERDAAVLRDVRIDLGFRDIVFEIDRAGIRPAAAWPGLIKIRIMLSFRMSWTEE